MFFGITCDFTTPLCRMSGVGAPCPLWSPGEGPLTEQLADARVGRRELVKMPQSLRLLGHSART